MWRTEAHDELYCKGSNQRLEHNANPEIYIGCQCHLCETRGDGLVVVADVLDCIEVLPLSLALF